MAVLSLVECIKNSGVSLKVEPALYLFAENDYTEEAYVYILQVFSSYLLHF